MKLKTVFIFLIITMMSIFSFGQSDSLRIETDPQRFDTIYLREINSNPNIFQRNILLSLPLKPDVKSKEILFKPKETLKSFSKDLIQITSLRVHSDSINIICEIASLKNLESLSLIVDDINPSNILCNLSHLRNLKSIYIGRNVSGSPYHKVNKRTKRAIKKLFPTGCIIEGLNEVYDAKKDDGKSIQLE